MSSASPEGHDVRRGRGEEWTLASERTGMVRRGTDELRVLAQEHGLVLVGSRSFPEPRAGSAFVMGHPLSVVCATEVSAHTGSLFLGRKTNFDLVVRRLRWSVPRPSSSRTDE